MAPETPRTATDETIEGLSHLPTGVVLQGLQPGDLMALLAQALRDGRRLGRREPDADPKGRRAPDAPRAAHAAMAQALNARDALLDAVLAMHGSGNYAAAFTWGPEGIRADQCARAFVRVRDALGHTIAAGAPTDAEGSEV